MAVASIGIPSDRIVVYLGTVLAVAGWILTGFMVCRLRAAYDSRIRFVAGRGGAEISFPSAPLPQRLFMAYRIKTFDVRARDVHRIDSHLSTVNGIRTASEMVVKHGDWTLRVDAMFFDSSAESLAENFRSALSGGK